MTPKALIAILIAAVIGIGGFFLYQDYNYRQQHGQVTAVDLFNYDQEVESVQDAKPVLIYFYKQDGNAAANEEQMKIVKKFAWANAHEVKVVSINVAHVENLPLAIANGAIRLPAFVFVSHGKHVSGQNGVRADYDELTRLQGLVKNQN